MIHVLCKAFCDGIPGLFASGDLAGLHHALAGLEHRCGKTSDLGIAELIWSPMECQRIAMPGGGLAVENPVHGPAGPAESSVDRAHRQQHPCSPHADGDARQDGPNTHAPGNQQSEQHGEPQWRSEQGDGPVLITNPAPVLQGSLREELCHGAAPLIVGVAGCWSLRISLTRS